MYHGYYYIFMCDFTFFVFLWYFYCISILMVADQLIGVEIYLNVANHTQNFIFFKIGKYALFIINFYLFTFKILKYLRKPYIYGYRPGYLCNVKKGNHRLMRFQSSLPLHSIRSSSPSSNLDTLQACIDDLTSYINFIIGFYS